MEKLKILIIADDKESSQIAKEIMNEILTSLNLMAVFDIIMDFSSSLKTLMTSDTYDAICVLDNSIDQLDAFGFSYDNVDHLDNGVKYSLFPIIDVINKSKCYFVLSSNTTTVDQLKEEEHPIFLLEQKKLLCSGFKILKEKFSSFSM